ncbi:25S rRNA (adenine645-N1)-methyltransferase [Savitreella phatthalungensis]
MFKVEGWNLPSRVKQGGSGEGGGKPAKGTAAVQQNPYATAKKGDSVGAFTGTTPVLEGVPSKKRKRDERPVRDAKQQSSSPPKPSSRPKPQRDASSEKRERKWTTAFEHKRPDSQPTQQQQFNKSEKSKQSATQPSKAQQKHGARQSPSPAVPPVSAGVPDSLLSIPDEKLTPMQRKMVSRLSGAHFRWINEQLYTTRGSEALALVRDRPEVFDAYHKGFREQVLGWPENPLDLYKTRVSALLTSSWSKKGKRSSKTNENIDLANALPNIKSKPPGQPYVVADIGCGEAALGAHARALDGEGARVVVKSFDLASRNEASDVTVCDVAAGLPLENSSVDIAVACLALMGTDWPSVVSHVARVLAKGGVFWVAEIKSRFDRGSGTTKKTGRDDKQDGGEFDAEGGVEGKDGDAMGDGEKAFVRELERNGLVLRKRDASNKMFVRFDFIKIGESGKKDDKIRSDDAAAILKPCLYKRR